MRRSDRTSKEWADEIRKLLMVKNLTDVTKTIDAIHVESGTTESRTNLSRPAHWTAGRKDSPLMELILRAGLEIQLKKNRSGEIESITFRLNETWRGVKQRFAPVNAP